MYRYDVHKPVTEDLSSRLTYFWWLWPLVLLPYLSVVTLFEWVTFFLSSWSGPFFVQLVFFTGLASSFGILSLRVMLPLKIVKLSGDVLLIRSVLKKVTIPVSQIDFVDGPDMTSLRRITIRIQTVSPIGECITFSPPLLSAHRVADTLRSLASN
jgi:hypothetical protein